MRDILTTSDIVAMTGWGMARVQRLCKSGQLPAKDISTGGKKARYVILRSEWEAFIRPDNAVTPRSRPAKRSRIDAGVDRVFG